MKCLVVSAHPSEQSLSAYLKSAIVSSLNNHGHKVVVEDLYLDEFDPVLSKFERESYYQRSGTEPEIQQQAKNLTEAEAIIILFPTWWFGFPAILKGWFDRVWAPGIAFEIDKNKSIKARLTELRKVIVITTLALPWWVDKLVMRCPGKRVLKQVLLRNCAPKCKLEFHSIYKVNAIDARQLAKHIQLINKRIGNL